MLAIRRGVFETNSSSMHSLIIKKEDDYLTKEELSQEVYLYTEDGWHPDGDVGKFGLYFGGDESYFGRSPFRVLSSFKEKLCYYIASICDNEDDFKAIEADVSLLFDGCKGISLWGCQDEFYPYGYAENYGSFKRFLQDKQISLREFLTNKKYVVIVDGDEYCEFEKLMQSGLIDDNNIEWIESLT